MVVSAKSAYGTLINWALPRSSPSKLVRTKYGPLDQSIAVNAPLCAVPPPSGTLTRPYPLEVTACVSLYTTMPLPLP